MSSRTTLKSYFLTGATPTEAQFADLIDSVLVLSEDLVDNFLSTSTTDALTANAGKILNDAIEAIDTRVTSLEDASLDYLSDYYTKSQVDAQISTVNTELGNKAFTSQVTNLENTITSLQSSLSGYSPLEHSHGIASITGLQNALDLKSDKTYVDNQISLLSVAIDAIDGIDSSHLDDYSALVGRVSTLESNESNFATTQQLLAKADAFHSHTVSDISDLNLGDYYNKTSVDALLADVEPKDHTHLESDITDLDKYTKAQTDQEILDHAALTNNPHGVTKTQVGLGNVQNLSVSEIFSHSDAPFIPTQESIDAIELASSTHIAQRDNPHEVTKAQVGLDQVPNIDVNALLLAHLADKDNPHEVDTVSLDVYTKAETQEKIEDNYDAHRYAFKPLSPTDGGGAVGDIVYGPTGVYFKFGPAEWRQIISSKVFNDGTADSKFEIETPTLEVVGTSGGDSAFTVDTTNDTTEINTATVSIAGSTTIASNLSATETQVSISSGLAVTQNVSIGGNMSMTGNNILTTLGDLRLATAAGSVQVDDDLDVTGTSFQVGGTTNLFEVSATKTNITTPVDISSDVSIAGNLSAKVNDLVLRGGSATTSKVEVDDSLSVTGSTTTVGLTSTSGGTFTGGAVTIGTSETNQNLNVNGNATISGDLTINGTTTSIDTTNLLIEDNIIVLNKNQTGTPPSTLKSGIEVERGDATNTKFYFDESSDRWKAEILGSQGYAGETITINNGNELYVTFAPGHEYTKFITAHGSPNGITQNGTELTVGGTVLQNIMDAIDSFGDPKITYVVGEPLFYYSVVEQATFGSLTYNLDQTPANVLLVKTIMFEEDAYA